MTSTALVPTAPEATTISRAVLLEQARGFAQASKASSTIRSYASAWRAFCGWCLEHDVAALPAASETVALYVADSAATLKVATINRHLAAIAEAHRFAGVDAPTSAPIVLAVMRGVRRTLGVAQAAKAPVVTKDLRRMVDALPAGILGVRDRALLLLGFAGALRRSELVALDVADLEFREEGLLLHLRRSKTDQEGRGREVAVPYGSRVETCPIRAVRAWLLAATIAGGPVFRGVDRHGRVASSRLSDKAVALVVKRAAERVGIDASRVAGHSLRAGLATAAAAAGVSERDIARTTGRRSMTVLRRYIREGTLFANNAAAEVGL